MANEGFDVSAFLSSTKVEGATSTQTLLPPEGETVGVVDDTDIEKWVRSGRNKQGEQFVTVNVPLRLTDERVLEQMKRERVVVTYDMFLDFTPNGALANGPGQNVRLGVLRRALGINDSDFNGDLGTLLNLMRGRGPIRVYIGAPRSMRADDPDSKVATVARVAPM